MNYNPYYTYEFVSPEPLYALVKEELNAYFLSGALDDTLFPLWTSKVLKKLTKGVLPIRNTFVVVEEGKALLPEECKGIREVWSLEQYEKTIVDPSSTYVKATASRLDSPDVKCNPCTECSDPPLVEAIYKVTSKVFAQFTRTQLLKPGRIMDTPFPCLNFQSQSQDIYDVDGRDLKVNFSSGTLYLVYYSLETDEHNYQLIPDDVYIQEAIESFIKFKLMEMLYNTASDESFNQSRVKKQEYEQTYLDKMVIATTWMKRPTREQRDQDYRRQKSRFNHFKFK
jgi:hypothetical protein